MRRILTPLILLWLSGCADLPSGEHRFSVLAGEKAEQRSWSIKGLASHGRINFTGVMREEATESKVSHLKLTFGDRDVYGPPATVTLHDPGCEGAYSVRIAHRTQENVEERSFPRNKLPWGKPLVMQAEWWPDGRLVIDIKDIGRSTVMLNGKVENFTVSVWTGGIEVDNLQYENLVAK